MRRDRIQHQFVEYIPEQLDEGVVYVSRAYGTAAHLCCCGCGNEVNNVIGPTDYKLEEHSGTITLHPSIGNWGFACRSHYYIRENRIIWLPAMSQPQIDAGRADDHRRKQAYFEQVNARGLTSFLRRLWKRLFG